MVKVVYCFQKAPHLSMEEFSEYWEKVHGRIGARIPGLRRLVQSVALHPDTTGADSAFDGMAELWFDDLSALAAARSTRGGIPESCGSGRLERMRKAAYPSA